MSECGWDSEPFLIEVDRRLRVIQDELRPGEAGSRQPVPGQATIHRMDTPTPTPTPTPSPRRGRSGPLAAILGRNRPPARARTQTADEPAPATEPEPERVPEQPAEARETPGAGELIEQVRALTEVQTQLLAASER